MSISLSESGQSVGACHGVARDDLERAALVPLAVVLEVVEHPVVREVVRPELGFYLRRTI
jgi:hypothetical protein